MPTNSTQLFSSIFSGSFKSLTTKGLSVLFDSPINGDQKAGGSKLFHYPRVFGILFFIMFSLVTESVMAQTPGQIIRKGNVTGGAPTVSVLDPNGDGWTSSSTSGFTSNDISQSEIPFQVVPTPAGEDPEGDLRRGATGGFSEIVSSSDDSGFFFYSDGTNLLFRLRIAGLVPGSKGYTVLIDSDGKFGNSGPNADPNWTASNPGFEYEIIYESNFRVAIYRIDGGTTPTLVKAYNLDTDPDHAQISVSLPNSSSPPDYFYDWYVPISDFVGEDSDIRITASTPLRMVATTVMAPKPAINGPASDIQGDDTEFRNPLDQWSNIISNQTGTAPDGSTGSNLLCTAPTRVTSPISPNPSSTGSVSGEWTSNTSVTSATIEVFRVRGATTTSLGTVVATSSSTWTLSGLAVGTLVDGDIIYATAQGTGQGICGESNSVLVQDCTPATTSVDPTIACATDRRLEVTSTVANAIIKIYRVTSTGETLVGTSGVLVASGSTFAIGTADCNSGSSRNVVPAGSYRVTQEAGGNCESGGALVCVPHQGGSVDPMVVTTTPTNVTTNITEASENLSGNAVAGSTVRLYKGGFVIATVTATGGVFSFDLSTLFLQAGDQLSIRAQQPDVTGTAVYCLSSPVNRTVVLSPVFCDLSSPFITNNGDGQIQAGTTISGLSSEANGTIVTVYNASTSAVIGTTTVTAGAWTLASPTAVAGTSYFARHTGTSCGDSNPSNTVQTLAASTATCGTITGPISEDAASVSGTGYSVGSTVRLFIDGAEIGDAVVTGAGTWSIDVNTTNLNTIYPGGVLTTTVENASEIPRSCPSSATVDCVPPAIPLFSPSPPSTIYTTSFSLTISNSVTGVLYYIVDDQTNAGLGQTIGTQRGASLFGNGGSLVLTSSAFMSVDGTYKFKVVANPLSSASCNSESAQFDVEKSTISVVEAILPDLAVTFTNVQVSGDVSSNDVLLGTITYSTSTVEPNATLTLNTDGTYDFVATAPGVYNYEINVCTDPDTAPDCPTSFLTITVTDPTLDTNPPVANPDVYPVLEGQTLTGNVLLNDIDLGTTGLIVTELNGTAFTTSETIANYGGSGGELVLNDDGTFTLTNPTVTGTYTFTYTLCDNDTPQNCADPVTVTIEVYPTGTPNLVYANDDYANISKGGTASGNLLTNDTQITGGAITAATPQTTTVAGVGTFVVDDIGDYTFTPLASFSGPYQFTYEALGASGATGIGTFHVTVEPFVVNPDIAVAFKDETISGSVATNDVVPAGSTYSTATVLANATLTLNTDGTYNFVAMVAGKYTYDIEVCAQTTPPGCETKTLTISVIDPTSAIIAPVANNDLAITLEGTAVTINVIANDQSGDPDASLAPPPTINSPAANGTATVDGNNILYTPDASYTGEDSFTYQICDGTPTCSIATVYVTVYATGTSNVVLPADDYFMGSISSAITGNVLTNDTQLSGGAITQVNNPVTDEAITGGELTLGADGSFSFAADPGFFGTTSYVYEAEGTDGATAQATLYITVGRGLVLTFNPACIGGVPYLQFTLQANFDANGLDIDILWSTGLALAGIPNPGSVSIVPTVSQTITTSPGDWSLSGSVYEYSGQTLWPGAAESGGVPTDWPAWVDLGGGNWVYQEDGFSGYRTNPGVVISVNPDAEITSGDLGYPPATPLCASSPSIAVSGTVWNDADESGQPDFTGIFTAGEAGTNAGGLSVVIIGEDQVTPDQDIIYAIVTVAADGTYEIPEFVRGTDYTLVLTNDVSTLSVNDVVADPNAIANLPSAVLATSPLVRTGVDLLDGVAIENLDFGVRRLLNEWTGTIDDDWCNAGNWNLGIIPVVGSDIRIANTATPPRFTGACPVCINNLTIDEDAELTIPSGVTICVTGTLDSQGEVIDAGNIAMRGTTPQVIIGDFNISNLEIDNPTGVTITTGSGNMVNITESIKLSQGILTTNDNLRLISDASGDAYFAPLSASECTQVVAATLGIIGNVRVQKFVDGGNRAFRFIAHPFNNTLSLQQIRDYVHITGEGLDFNSTGNPSAFWYVTSDGNQDEEEEDSGWVPVSSTNIGEWLKGRAVRMMFRGPRTQGGVVGDDNYNPLDVTYELIGSVNLCDQTLTGLVRSGTPGSGTGSAFNFIGNPYPAAIDLKTIPAGDRTDVGANYYVWQPRVGIQSGSTVFNTGSGRGGNYVTEPFDGGIPALGHLATGTGFFVTANVNGAELTFTEANKLAQKQLASGAAVTFRTDGDIASRYGANSLQLAIDINGEQIDRVLVYFDDATKAKVDNMDATKFENPAVNFFTVSEDDYAMAIDRRPWVAEEEYRIPLHILSPAEKYTLTVPDFDLDAGRVLQLHDRHLDKLITLEKGTTYEFEVTADQATKGHRFDIVMGVEVITSIEKNADRFQAFLLPNPAQQQVMVSIQRPDEIADTHVRLVDIRGVKLYETILKATDDAQISYEVGSLAKGVYLVEITHGKQRIVKRLMVN